METVPVNFVMALESSDLKRAFSSALRIFSELKQVEFKHTRISQFSCMFRGAR